MHEKIKIFRAETLTELGICTIEPATESDDPWLRHLSKIYSNQIGFIPDAARRNLTERNYIKLISLNCQPCGFFIASHGIRKIAHLSQIAISEECWSNGIADFAIEALVRNQETAQYNGITALIRQDLRLNGVAHRMGAHLIQVRHPPTKRALPIHHWHWPAPTVRAVHFTPSICTDPEP